ncbi:hypothetical protein LXL04_008950 [Taraxacum kok-saghyz]
MDEQVCCAKSILRNMLFFQYLVSFLEGDFVTCNLSFKENSDWITLRESFLNMILVSRKIIYKGLIKDCLSAMFLKSFSNGSNTKCIIKKMSTEVAQLLLAHAFQAYISLPSQDSSESKEDDNDDNSLPDICNHMISAFTCLMG